MGQHSRDSWSNATDPSFTGTLRRPGATPRATWRSSISAFQAPALQQGASSPGAFARDACVVDHDVESVEDVNRVHDDPLRVVGDRDPAIVRYRLASCSGDLVGHLLGERHTGVLPSRLHTKVVDDFSRDVFLLAADALSEWAMCAGAEDPSVWRALSVFRSAELIELVDSLRIEHAIDNDDTTLLRCVIR